MSILPPSSPIEAYRQYLYRYSIPSASFPHLLEGSAAVNWEEPETALDLNNFAVLALIEAEQSEDSDLRTMHLNMALEALTTAVEKYNHPLCIAHLSLVHCMTGNTNVGINAAFSALLGTLQPAYSTQEALPSGLVYLPLKKYQTLDQKQLNLILQTPDAYLQALRVMAWVLYQFQLVFYNLMTARFMRLALQITPNAADLHLKLGLSCLMGQQWEGLANLHQANSLAPNHPSTVQALYLAYQELKQPECTRFWHQIAQEQLQLNSQATEWQWAKLGENHSFTYVPFDDGLVLAVEPHFQSIVTTVLLGQGDWFEAEIEFWRNQLQPGMVVIDVGANAGVYTFSAARQVGAEGRVLAIEPFSKCVEYLQETRRVNHLDWVTICAGAASDHPGTARLSLHSASELNEVVRDDIAPDESGQFEVIECFTLDGLVEREQLQRVDWLKIDAEGHEMQVLAGGERLISEFAPAILYENIAATQSSNTPVAELLQMKGYQLFRYQPYLRSLVPIQSISDLQGNLNIVALPPNHPLV